MTMSGKPVGRAVALLGTSLGLLLGGFAGTVARAQPADERCAGRTSNGPWTSISAPAFARGAPMITDLAVDATDERLMLVTNGSAVTRTVDGGCSWQPSFDLGDLPAIDRPYTAATARIAFIGPLGGGTAVMVIEQTLPAPRPRVLVTTDGGISWREAAVGLEAVRGRPLALAVGGQNIYLLVDVTRRVGDIAMVAPPHPLYVSRDGGLTWEPRAAEPEGTDVQVGPIGPVTIGGDDVDGELVDIAVNPSSPDQLWLHGSAGLYHSNDAGASAMRIEPSLGPVADFDITTFTGGSQILTAYADGSARARRSLNGDPFADVATPTPVAAAAFPAVSGPEGIFIERFGPLDLTSSDALARRLRNPRWRDVTPPGGLALGGLQTMGTLGSPIVFGHTETTIERYEDNPRGLGVVAPAGYDVGALPELDIRRAPPRLSGPARVSVPPGQVQHALYELSLPPIPRKVDIMFLVDDSRSMIPAITGVKLGLEQIIRDLAAAGLDVWFGVGRYCAPQDPPSYERLLEVSPPGPELAAALNRMETNCGGLEMQLGSAYEAVTGDGLFAAAGQEANFRPKSLRIILNVTDEAISQGAGHPSYELFAATLNAADVRHIGLAIQNEVGTTAATVGDCCPAPGLRRAGLITGTVAPAGGADCNGDSLPDLAPGEPLVCVVSHALAESGAVMSEAIVNTVKAVAKNAGVGIDASARPDVVERIMPGEPLVVDLFEPNLVRFEIAYRCPALLEGSQPVPVEVVARRDSVSIDRMTTIVACKGRPSSPPRILFTFPFPLALPPPPPPRVPETVPNINPQLNPQLNPNPQAQAQAQVGLAAQQQRQPQLAWVEANRRPAPEPARERATERYAFSRYRQDPEVSAQYLTLAAGFLICLAATGLAHSRVGVAPAHARPRRKFR